MIKQNHLVLMLVHYFNIMKILIILFLSTFYVNITFAENEVKNNNLNADNFPAAVIDMKKVLSKSSAFSTLQKEMQEIENNFKKDIKKEEEELKKEKNNLVAQKSVLSEEQFKEKENQFKQKVNKVQSKVEKIRRELEATMAKGMQIIQQEAVKHMKDISIKKGYLLVFDANSTVIAADIINISNLVADKLNKSLPKITIDQDKEKKVD